jgi:hypothetical protein
MLGGRTALVGHLGTAERTDFRCRGGPGVVGLTICDSSCMHSSDGNSGSTSNTCGRCIHVLNAHCCMHVHVFLPLRRHVKSVC